MSESKTPRTDRAFGLAAGQTLENEETPYECSCKLEAELTAALQRAREAETARETLRKLHSQAEADLDAMEQRAEKAVQSPCTCVPDGDDGTVAHLCQWHKKQFGKAYRMQNIADTLTVENILKLPPDNLRRFIAHGIQESTARKKAEAEREAMREDAERYRWLKTRAYKDGDTLSLDVAAIEDIAIKGIEFKDGDGVWRANCPSGTELDSIIDAAMGKK